MRTSLLVILLGLSLASPGQFSQQRMIAPLSLGPVVQMDFDQDGIEDLFTIGPEIVSWLRNDGTGLEHAQAVYTSDHFIEHLRSGDVDNNGFQDLVVLGEYQFPKLLMNMGNLSFLEVELPVVPWDAWGIAIELIDMDNDQKLDIVSHNWPIIYWMKNYGNLEFGPWQSSIPEDMYQNDYEFIDLDGDNDPDVVTISSSLGQLVWYENDGNGNFTDSHVIFNSDVETPHRVVTGDINSDGAQDLVLVNYNDLSYDVFHALLNDGSGGFTDVFYDDFYIPSLEYALIDLDNDGNLDLLNRYDGYFDFFSGNGDGTFNPEADMDSFPDQLNSAPHKFLAYDLDGNDLIDFLEMQATGGLVVYKNNDGFNFTDYAVTISGTIGELNAGDIDGDDKPDIFTGCLVATGHTRAMQGEGHVLSYSIVTNFFPSEVPLQSQADLGDLDGDGDLDAAGFKYQSGVIWLGWWKNQGVSGFTFQNLNEQFNEIYVGNVLVGDFTGDGINDIAFCQEVSGNFSRLYKGNGNGTFQEFVLDSPYSGQNKVQADDDPDWELGLAQFGGFTTMNWSGTQWTAGGFYDDAILEAGFVDVNHDGMDDVLTIQLDENYLHAYLNNGDGTYENTSIDGVTAYYAYDFKFVARGDFDGDGWEDVIIYGNFDQITNTARVYRNDWNNNFEFWCSIDIPPLGLLGKLVPVDWDGDGDLDILGSENSEYKIWWWENMGTSPYSINGTVFIDQNGNGMQDGDDSPMNLYSVTSVPEFSGAYSDNDGHYTLVVNGPGDYNLNLNYNTNLWSLSTPSDGILEVQVTEGDPNVMGQNFGLYPLDPISQVELNITTNPQASCFQSAVSWITMTNTGNTAVTGDLCILLDSLVTGMEFTLPPTTTTEYSACWHVTEFGPGEYISISFGVTVDEQYIGTILTHKLTFIPDDGIETIVLGEQEVVCSYDPNFKELTSQTVGTYELVSMEVEPEYTIHFQNLGNEAAHDVTIVDALSPYLDPTTLEITSSSHSVQTSIDESGVVQFFFDEIMLPDSLSDPEGSHGFVSYRIQYSDAAGPGVALENQAAIYFDFNSPIFTNTTHHLIYDCEYVQASEFLQTVDPQITVDGLMLISNYTSGNMWYSDGGLIESQVASTFQPWWTANFQLGIMDPTGCIVLSDPVLIVQVDENVSIQPMVYPNPTNDLITINLPEVATHDTKVRITNLLGETVMIDLCHPGMNTYSLEDLARGIYFLNFPDSSFRPVRLVKQ